MCLILLYIEGCYVTNRDGSANMDTTVLNFAYMLRAFK